MSFLCTSVVNVRRCHRSTLDSKNIIFFSSNVACRSTSRHNNFPWFSLSRLLIFSSIISVWILFIFFGKRQRFFGCVCRVCCRHCFFTMHATMEIAQCHLCDDGNQWCISVICRSENEMAANYYLLLFLCALAACRLIKLRDIASQYSALRIYFRTMSIV